MATQIYFISDIHLHCYYSESEKRKQAALLDFLDQVKAQKATLYIVGDLFDFWFEYKYVIPRHFFRILRQLQEMVDAGCEIHVLAGNHDYWFESFITVELGVQFHPSSMKTTIAGKSFFIYHGDGILRRDRGYRLMKRILRNRLFIFLFRLIHPDIAFKIAKAVSGKSRHLTLRDPDLIEQERKELIQYGEKIIDQGFDVVVTGHFHLPTDHRYKNGQLINLGDWIRYFSFGYFDGHAMRLCYWKRQTLKTSL
ncbi:MAG TPA: UDP-2,3-diacylglucosamine diphosphatase [Candidatus Marinimicrobia bacterium]|nr:UDP-2,3-diacylglucosamine diphosphatase [Candidatus Neomarinimicrobiota bacterium]